MPRILLLALLLCPRTHQAQERADADELFRQAREMGIAGRRAEARQICKRVLEYSPDNRDARILLGPSTLGTENTIRLGANSHSSCWPNPIMRTRARL